jgi:hypothetical protein
MALDPQISLGVRPPVLQPLQIQSPLERYGKVLTLRGLMEQQQLRGLQMQGAQQELAAGERKAQEDERRRQAIAKFQARFAGGQQPTAQQIWEDLGPDGTKVVSEMYDAETKRIGVEQARAARFHSRAQSILDQNTDFALRYNIEQALADGDIAPQHAEEFLKYGISDPRTKTALTSIRDQGMKATEQLEEQRKDAEEKRKLALHAPELAKKTAESLAEQLGVAAQTAPNNQADWTLWREDLSPELQKRIPAMFSPVAREQVRMLGVKPTAPVPGRDVPYSKPVEEQMITLEGAKARAHSAATAGAARAGDPGLIDTVKRNPALFDNLSPETKARIAPYLEAAGFTDFGTKASDTELTKIQDTEKGLGALKALRKKIRDNPGAVGPISGKLRYNPWATERRKLQADIDAAKQIIGKAMEGGVLRKEDEEKYARILPTMDDPPDIADYKLEQLDEMMNRDLGSYKANLRAAGRRIGAPASNRTSLPGVGSTYNGGKVISVTRIE